MNSYKASFSIFKHLNTFTHLSPGNLPSKSCNVCYFYTKATTFSGAQILFAAEELAGNSVTHSTAARFLSPANPVLCVSSSCRDGKKSFLYWTKQQFFSPLSSCRWEQVCHTLGPSELGSGACEFSLINELCPFSQLGWSWWQAKKGFAKKMFRNTPDT